MRSLTRDELQKIWNEEDMLKGNINRMCVTDDMEEFERMFEFAKKRILTIYTINLFRLRGEKNERKAESKETEKGNKQS